MHITLLSVATILAAKATTATTVAAKAKPQAGPGSLLIYLIPLLIIAYLLIIRPKQKRQQAARQGSSAIVEGDTVATIGGIVGTVISIDSERAVLQVGPDTEMEFLRQAVARKLDPVVHVTDDDADEEDTDAPEDDDEDRGWHGYHPDDDPEHAQDADPDADTPSHDTAEVADEDVGEGSVVEPTELSQNGVAHVDKAERGAGPPRNRRNQRNQRTSKAERAGRPAPAAKPSGGAKLGAVFGVSPDPDQPASSPATNADPAGGDPTE
jgi:preprotein translocase subunit YajC